MKHNENLLPCQIILLAVQGDVMAMKRVLKHFERYMIKLSQKTLYDEFGNSYVHVEPETKSVLEAKLMKAILEFEII